MIVDRQGRRFRNLRISLTSACNYACTYCVPNGKRLVAAQDELSAEAMARGGILLEYGALSSEPTPFPLFNVLGKSLTLKGYLYSEIVSDDAALARAKAFIVNGLDQGTLAPKIAKVFPFTQIQDAHRYLESNEQIGKVVVTV